MQAAVECRSEFTYAERPVALYWEEKRLEIVEVLASWQTPYGRHFHVRAENDCVFALMYKTAEDLWEIRLV